MKEKYKNLPLRSGVGIVVLNKENKIFVAKRIDNKKNFWQMPQGGVDKGEDFYEAAIKMNNVSFFGNRAEDALNIVRSEFELKSIRIKDTASDAIDSDFSQGTIEKGIFQNIGSKEGGDGIDASGSEIIVKEAHFVNISDKALSVGENSYLKASGLNIEDVSIGAASKDGSRLLISDSKMEGIEKAGLMAYIKKPIYGTAEIVAKDLSFNSTKNNNSYANSDHISFWVGSFSICVI